VSSPKTFGEMAKCRLDASIHRAREALAACPMHLDAYDRLIRTVQARSILLARRTRRPMPPLDLDRGLFQLAMHSADWVRPVEDWSAPDASPWTQFASLAAHLVARYPVPRFMASAWLAKPEPQLPTCDWYKRLGRGENVRRIGLSMKGRTPASLWKLVTEWHRELGRSAFAGTHWPRSGLREHAWTERVVFRKGDALHAEDHAWSIHELSSTTALRDEGRAMRHCVLTCAQACIARRTSIWSMRVETPNQFVRVLTIEVDMGRRRIVQARRRFNALPSEAERVRLARWAERERLSTSESLRAQRPSGRRVRQTQNPSHAAPAIAMRSAKAPQFITAEIPSARRRAFCEGSPAPPSSAPFAATKAATYPLSVTNATSAVRP
jgi:hypothetical protein